VLAYETLSETDSSLDPGHSGFRPNAFVDVSLYLDDKVAAMRTYRSEFGEFPFPRSEHGIRALAAVRGLASGFAAAEAFMLLTERR
jgi:LmbE family N-acetylglucosaminyl deacetylase